MTAPNDERILYLLKTRGAQTAAGLASRLDITPVGARQHLDRLRDQDLVAYEDRREAVGRPKRYWRLTDHGHARFPDTHGHLTVELIGSIRSVFGEDGLDRIIARREMETLSHYQAAIAPLADLQGKVSKLAEIRDSEGYMAQWRCEPDGSYLLVENHCPMCAAATTCQGFCRSELAIFESVLGDDVLVSRVEHVLEGGRRCAYRIATR
ncbi:MAG: helix-turn-helix transcriptional regulator [Gammaproteobacteria bacterium]